MSRFERRRRAGLLIPLFSLHGTRSWGIGDLADLSHLCRWLGTAGQRCLQLLPVWEMGPGERSPYGALSGFALDPIYVALGGVEDFVAAGGLSALGTDTDAELAAVRAAPDIAYAQVRHLKRRALASAYAHFAATELRTGSLRARAFDRFCDEHRGWLDDYVLFRALRERHGEQTWTTWPRALRARQPGALAAARADLGERCRLHAYVQWVAAEQWAIARNAAAAAGVALLGDVPFMVSRDSADVWARQDEFRLDASVGTPPDAFTDEGQDWGLPVMCWDVMRDAGHAWWRARMARVAELFDGTRIDHVVGYYRIYERPHAGEPAFRPPDETAQLALGEELLRVAREAAGPSFELLAEDLGSVPDWVRASLTRAGIPGLRVLRWETDDGRFRDPLHWPALSVGTTGTHDTSPLATWWERELDDGDRRALAALPAFAGLAEAGAAYTPAIRDALLEGVHAAGSALVLLPFPDTHGGTERINVPGTIDDTNWAYRLPWPIEELGSGDGATLRDRLRALAVRHGRAPA